MAILALKTLSSLSDDRQKYRILFRLGTGEQEQNRTLFYQIFCFFLLPFVVPVLLSVPTAQICTKIMEMSGYAGNVSEVVTTTTAIAFVVVAIYVVCILSLPILLPNGILSIINNSLQSGVIICHSVKGVPYLCEIRILFRKTNTYL